MASLQKKTKKTLKYDEELAMKLSSTRIIVHRHLQQFQKFSKLKK